MMRLPFQTDANRWRRLGLAWLHSRRVRIVALGTGKYDPLAPPAAYPFTMTTKIPVPLTVGVAGTANEVRLVEFDFLVTR